MSISSENHILILECMWSYATLISDCYSAYFQQRRILLEQEVNRQLILISQSPDLNTIVCFSLSLCLSFLMWGKWFAFQFFDSNYFVFILRNIFSGADGMFIFIGRMSLRIWVVSEFFLYCFSRSSVWVVFGKIFLLFFFLLFRFFLYWSWADTTACSLLLEGFSTTLYDIVRPLVVRCSSLDVLCSLIETLKKQILEGNLSTSLSSSSFSTSS
jgi:hypothetical protein